MGCSRHLWWLLHGSYVYHPLLICDFYMMYFSYLKKVWTTLIFITLIVFIIFPVLWIQHIWIWTWTHSKISKVIVPIKIFYSMSLGMLLIKLENQLIARVYNIPNAYQRQNTTCFLIILEQTFYVASYYIPMLTWFWSIVTHDTSNKKKKTMRNESFTHCIHTVWIFFSHNMWNID